MNQAIEIPKLSLSDAIRGLLLALLVVIGTFPENDWSYSIGIDPPLYWVFNHLFETGLNAGRHIIFPHGPLAFFMYPLSDNILLATLVTSLLKGLLVFNIAFLFNDSKNQAKWLVAFAFAYLVSQIAHFNHLILANIILLFCNYYQSKFKPYKFLALFIVAFAFFVKAYVAIVAGTLFFSFVAYLFVQQKNVKNALIDGLSLLGFILMFWLLMFGTLRGFLNFIWGMVHLAQDNSSAAAYYPQNNWFVLVLFFICIVALFLLNRSKKSSFYAILISLSLFASWKHGMAREDIYHTKGFLIYLLISSFIFVLFHRKKYVTNLILAVAALFLFTINQHNVANYFPYKHELFSVNNFVDFAINFKELKKKSLTDSDRNIAINHLPKSIREKIGDERVDIYPWDYSIAGANQLNWQPRVVIQSYAAYTSWLDKQNAKHFSSELAPDFLIWENKKTTTDVNSCDFNSLDNRYLLNDEPQTILQLISNYKHAYSKGKFRLFEHREKPLTFKTNSINTLETNWGEWIQCPGFKLELLRAKVSFSKNLPQRLKSFFYKDEQFWIYLKLKDGSTHKFRIVPKNAVDGLWINPYIFENKKVLEIQGIMFKASNQKMLSQKISIEWEELEFNESPHTIGNFFQLNRSASDSLLFLSTHNFEQPLVKHWSETNEKSISTNSFGGDKANTLSNTPYSSTFRFPLDSIPFGELRITADAWIKAPNYKQTKNISLVLTVEGEKGRILYKRITIDQQLIDRRQWNNVFKSVNFTHNTSNCELGIYVWSPEGEEVYIDDFSIRIYAKN